MTRADDAFINDEDFSPYSEKWLQGATKNQLRDALSRDTAARTTILKEYLVPTGLTAERVRHLDIRIAQVRNALHVLELKDFWEFVLSGCSLDTNGASDNHIVAEHADAKFAEWLKTSRREKEDRLEALTREDLAPNGKALRALEIEKEFLVRGVQQRIAIYKQASDEFGNPEMLLPARLRQLLYRTMTTVGHALLARKDYIDQYFRAISHEEPFLDSALMKL
jgi:hypothetical protein